MDATPEQMDKLRSIITDIEVAMLTTRDAAGLHARPMPALTGGATGVIRFLARQRSEAAREIEDDAAIGVTFAQAEKRSFVSLTAVTRIVADRAAIEHAWTPRLDAWFQGGPRDPDLVLLEATIETAEMWDREAGRMVYL